MRADWVSVSEARQAIFAAIPVLDSVRLPLLDCLGSVLNEDIDSPVDLPPWANSGMDGFAVRAEDVLGASATSPRILKVVEDIPAGSFPTLEIRSGTASRVSTGAPVPTGADGVIRVEHTDGGSTHSDRGWTVEVRSDVDAGKNVRQRGEDLRTGERVLSRGMLIRAAEIGMAASIGRQSLDVVRAPRVAILASGDELVDVDRFDEVIAGKKIISSNSYSLAAQVLECGAKPEVIGIAADSPHSIREHLERARGCDALITTAGVSVGEHDYIRDVLLSMGLEIVFWRVKMRPGSPFGFGRVRDLGGIPWFGLPGNPVSSMVTSEIFAKPALRWMAGMRAVHTPTISARFLDDLSLSPGLTQFPRVRLNLGEDGTLSARLTGAQGSGILNSMAAADGLLVIPETGAGARAGEMVSVIALGGMPLRETPGY